jgi:hypothetical protein
MKILDYEMVAGVCHDVPTLEKRVKELVAAGWEIYGTPMLAAASRGFQAHMYQCMVLPDPVGRKSCRWVAPTATEPGRWEPVKLASSVP